MFVQIDRPSHRTRGSGVAHFVTSNSRDTKTMHYCNYCGQRLFRMSRVLHGGSATHGHAGARTAGSALRKTSSGTATNWHGFLAHQLLHPSERTATRPIHTARAASSRLARAIRRKTCGAERHRAVEARGMVPTADRDASLEH